MKNEHGLTQQQEAFARLLVEGMSQADAYRGAYKSSAKWKAATVHECASRLAMDRKIHTRVCALQAIAAEASSLKAADILNETKRVALSDIGGVIGVKDGKVVVLMPNELDPATRAAVKSFEIDDLGRIKYAFWDKNVSLERAAKLLGLFEKDNKQKVDALADLLSGLNGNVLGASPGAAVFEPTKDDDD